MADIINKASDTAPDVASDVIYDSPCRPCADDDKNTDGICFCFQCQTCFCQTCVGHHNKCFKTHSLFYKTSEKPQVAQQQSEMACDKHPGHSIHMYCGEHYVVCCAICIAVDHRLCKGVDYIPKLTKEILKGRNKKDVKGSLEVMTEKVKTLKASKLEDIATVTSEMEDAIHEIRSMAKRIEARVKALGTASISEIQMRRSNEVEQMKNGIKYLDDLLTNIERQVQKIDQYKGDNEAKLFVLLNKALEIESDCKRQLESEKSGLKNIKHASYKVSNEIESLLDGFEFLCSFGDGEGPGLPGINPGDSDASPMGEFKVTHADKCYITDYCTLDDGGLVLADSGNNMLIRLDERYIVRDWFPKSCSGICTTSPDELVVLTGTTVQFMYLGRSIVHTRSFEVKTECTEKVRKYSNIEGNRVTISLSKIVFSENKLHIAAGINYQKLVNYSYHTTNTECVVVVYDILGSPLETITLDFDLTKHITIDKFSLSIDGSRMFFATGQSGLITLKSDGSFLSKITDVRLQGLCSFAEGNNGQIFICGKGSGNVFLVDKHGTVVEEILGRVDGIDAPCCIMYIKASKRLLVFCEEKNTVKVFHMN